MLPTINCDNNLINKKSGKIKMAEVHVVVMNVFNFQENKLFLK